MNHPQSCSVGPKLLNKVIELGLLILFLWSPVITRPKCFGPAEEEFASLLDSLLPEVGAVACLDIISVVDLVLHLN